MKNLANKHAWDGITVNDVARVIIPDGKTVEGTAGLGGWGRRRRLLMLWSCFARQGI